MAKIEMPEKAYAYKNGKYHLARAGYQQSERLMDSVCNRLLWIRVEDDKEVCPELIENLDKSQLCKKCFAGLIIDGELF